MIIFGTRGTAMILAMLTFVCANCHVPAAQRIIKRVTKFTLFFIPLFPVSTSYLVECVYCGVRTPIDKKQADAYEEYAFNARVDAEVDAEIAAESNGAGQHNHPITPEAGK